MRALAATVIAAGLLAAAVAATGASAATYTVNTCKGDGSVADGVVFNAIEETRGLRNREDCTGGAPAKGIFQETTLENVSGSVTWRINAPAGTTIQKVEASRSTSAPWPDDNLIFEVINAAGTRFDIVNGTAVSGQKTYAVQSRSIIVGLRCRVDNCRVGPLLPDARLGSIVTTIDDPAPPTIELKPSPATSGSVRGAVPIPFTAQDVGGGIASSDLIVDGIDLGATIDLNDDKCAEPFHFLVPCRPAIDSSLLLDTTELTNGPHQVQIKVTDPAGQSTISEAVTITVDNSPVVVPPPVNSGNPPSTPVTTLVPRMTLPPALSGLSLSPKNPVPGKRAKLSFTGNTAGMLTVSVAPVGKGAARRKPAKPLATVTAAVAAGPGSVPIRTRVKGKLLRPGSYLLSATLRSADGRASAPATLRFKVLAR